LFFVLSKEKKTETDYNKSKRKMRDKITGK